MLYRKAINWPLGDDDDPHAIAVSFVRESAHGEVFAGDDRDGEVVEVRVSSADLNERLERLAARKQVGEPSPLSFSSDERTSLFAAIFALAERDLVAQAEGVAGVALPAFEARPNLWTIAEEEAALAIHRGVSARDERGTE